MDGSFEQKASQNDPQIKKQNPKIIVKGRWIFQVEDVNISGENNQVKEQKQLKENCTFHDPHEKAKPFRPWSKNVSDTVSGLNKN